MEVSYCKQNLSAFDTFLYQIIMIAALSWQEQVNFQWDDDEIHFVLDKHA
jgi:hypothetical protein